MMSTLQGPPNHQDLNETEDPGTNNTPIQFLKYVLLGAGNFILTLVVFLFLTKAISVNYILSLITAWCIGMIYMYATNFLWVFKANSALRFDVRFARFFLVGLLSISANSTALAAIVEKWDTDPFWTQMALMPIVVLFNFAATKSFSFREKGLLK